MTWVEWMAARQLLYEEHLGIHVRASDNRKSVEYARSTARLKRQQG